MNGAMFAGQSYLQEILKALQELNLTFNFGSGLVSIAAYVLLALGLYGIAKKRGIHYPWLAWLPVGNAWLLGCISDQYRFVVKGETKNHRKRMLVLSVINLALALVIGLAAQTLTPAQPTESSVAIWVTALQAAVFMARIYRRQMCR